MSYALKYLMKGYKKAGEGIYTRACIGRMRGNGFYLKMLDTTRKFFAARIGKH